MMLRARLLAAFALALLPSVVNAQSFLGAEYSGFALYDIDRATGNFTTLCDPSTSALPGIAWNPNTATLYGTDETNLYTVNRTTCVATLVGAHGAQVTGLTFNTAFTTLYAIGYNGNLYAINPATGAATSVGPIGAGIGTPGYDVTDLATRSDGAVFSAGVDNNLYSVNLATGAFTNLGALTGTTGLGLTAIAFDNLNVLYGIDTGSDRLMTVNTATRVATDVSTVDIGSDVRGLAFIGAAAAPQVNVPVPALDTLGLLLLMGLLGIAGFVVVRRA
jgi:hypothetical protein